MGMEDWYVPVPGLGQIPSWLAERLVGGGRNLTGRENYPVGPIGPSIPAGLLERLSGGPAKMKPRPSTSAAPTGVLGAQAAGVSTARPGPAQGPEATEGELEGARLSDYYKELFPERAAALTPEKMDQLVAQVEAENAPSVPGRAWGGGGYTPVPGTRIVGGATIPGSGFPSLTGGPIFAGNTPEIAQRAALAGLTKETPTGIESRGAFSPGRRPDTYLSKSWEEVANTESPLIQDLWQENFNKQRANQLMEAQSRTELARAQIAEQQAIEAALPWEEQMKRLGDRQLATVRMILQQEMPGILQRVDDKLRLMAAATLRETGKPIPPEELEIARRNALEEQKQIVLARWLTFVDPETLQNFYRSPGLTNPWGKGGLGGEMMPGGERNSGG